ncbi:hypothetical protein AKJ57_05320 [candidate division MSBL1 archaeon SCGC-AAA259A05]|uniref:Transposase IS4-like domain-containing protein n=1 Tax=candidate division MSBL1 archaeon SCGC-AAA259A05 TaxID=1698259 RepID=A0A133U5F8_9EURY|nr:hypothetical protein AKJ57_05320 [candidate division MSBL1 archaeon SCGC-AAA259A05]
MFFLDMKQINIEKINNGTLDDAVLRDFVFSLTEDMKEKIFQRFYREKMNSENKKFAEYLLVELVRTLLRMPPVTFYYVLKHEDDLRELLGLEKLKTIGNYEDFDRKRKYLKMHLNRIMKRNLKTEAGNFFVLNLTIGEADVNKLRKGEAVKKGLIDPEFLHSMTKGTVVGFQVAYLINLSKLSFEKLKIYSKHAEKKRIWEEMVKDELGTKQGNIKSVLADAGFFAYINYLDSARLRIIPVIKARSNCEEKLMEKLENCDSNLVWFGKKYRNQLEELLEEFEEILQKTMKWVKNYDDFKDLRGKIEHIFKAAKMIFGMDEMHVYYRKHCFWKAFIILYMSSLLCQFIDLHGINKNRAIPLLAQNRHFS